MALANIQNRLDDLEPDGTLPLEKGDYAPCVINKPVTLLCDGSTFWTDGSAPAIVVRSPDVTIKDANLRCIATPDHVVFHVEANCHPLLQNVRISGHAAGVEPESAEWILPSNINTGKIRPQNPGFFLELGVPQRAQIVCRISGVSMDPSALGPGINAVKLQIRDAMPDSMLIGEVEIIGGVLTRLIPFFARISTGASSSQDGAATMLFAISPAEKERFQKLLAGESPSGNAHQPDHPKQATTEAASPAKEKSASRKPKTTHAPPVIQPKATSSWYAQKSSVTRLVSDENTPKLGGAFSLNVRHRRMPVYILADCSGSVSSDSIKSVEAGINALVMDRFNDPSALETEWISMITFGEKANLVIPLTELPDFKSPAISATNGCALGSALRLLCESLEKETRQPNPQQKGDWKPIIFIFTSGLPTDRWQEAAEELKSKYKPKIVAIACGDAADITVLRTLTDTVLEMKNISSSDFSAFFRWTGVALDTISEVIDTSHQEADLKAPATFTPVLGKLFQESIDTKTKSKVIVSPVSSTPSESGSHPKPNSDNSKHLSKLFTDSSN